MAVCQNKPEIFCCSRHDVSKQLELDSAYFLQDCKTEMKCVPLERRPTTVQASQLGMPPTFPTFATLCVCVCVISEKLTKSNLFAGLGGGGYLNRLLQSGGGGTQNKLSVGIQVLKIRQIQRWPKVGPHQSAAQHTFVVMTSPRKPDRTTTCHHKTLYYRPRPNFYSPRRRSIDHKDKLISSEEPTRKNNMLLKTYCVSHGDVEENNGIIRIRLFTHLRHVRCR